LEWVKKYHLFDKFKDGATNGFLDAGSGITLADKACSSKRREKKGVAVNAYHSSRLVYMHGICVNKLASNLSSDGLTVSLTN
jgi:hypothetical protein